MRKLYIVYMYMSIENKIYNVLFGSENKINTFQLC